MLQFAMTRRKSNPMWFVVEHQKMVDFIKWAI